MAKTLEQPFQVPSANRGRRKMNDETAEIKDDSLIELEISEEVISQVPESIAREHAVLPIEFHGDTITLATQSASDLMLQDQLRFLLNRNIQFVYRKRAEVLEAINFYYGQVEGESADSMLRELDNIEFTDTAIDFCESDVDAVGRICAEYAPSHDHRQASGARMKSFGTRNLSHTKGNGWMYFTISEGERVLVYRPSGQIELVEGPRRIWKGLSRFEPMKHFVAHPSEYLSILFRDGREETMVGPTDVWLDLRVHESIAVKPCLELAAKEAVVVYGAIPGENGTMETVRNVFNGPGLFAPKPGQWLHRFSWHAASGGSRGAEKKPNALRFEKLCLMPDQMYHDVRDVRTSDDAVLTIRLMIFFELIDIDRMLDTTRDPIGDFINAATSDVVEFTGKLSFEDFKQQTELLNEIATYQQLLHRAGQCGYQINNVVYRGYGAPDSLQAMHDEAIASRTRLQLERATERQSQELEDYQLSCQMERSAKRRTEQMNEVQHDLEMKRQRDEAERSERERRGLFQREQLRAQEQLSLELQTQRDSQRQSHLEALRTMQVDLTAYLTQARADQVIEVRGESGTRPELHLATLGTSKARISNGRPSDQA